MLSLQNLDMRGGTQAHTQARPTPTPAELAFQAVKGAWNLKEKPQPEGMTPDGEERRERPKPRKAWNLTEGPSLKE